MGISKPSQSCAKHQKDMAVLFSGLFSVQKRQHDEQAALRRLESNISLRITIWLNHEQSRIPP